MYFIARVVYVIHGPPVFSILGAARPAAELRPRAARQRRHLERAAGLRRLAAEDEQRAWPRMLNTGGP